MIDKKNIKKIGFFVGLVIVAILTYFLYQMLSPYLMSLSNYEKVRDWATQNGLKGQVLFTLLVALQVVVAFIPGGPMEIGAGYAYGPFLGMILSLLGIILGSVLVYYFVKRFGRPFVRLFISEEKLDNIHLFKEPKRLYRIIFIVFLIPGTPKDLLTYAMAFTNIPLSKWLALTIFARIPATFVSTYAGEAILKGDYFQVSMIFVIVMILSILGYFIFNKANEKRVELKERLH